jgi:hypothetical protein
MRANSERTGGSNSIRLSARASHRLTQRATMNRSKQNQHRDQHLGSEADRQINHGALDLINRGD